MLATFYTLAYHLFAFTYKGRQYELPDEEFDLEDQADACDISLHHLRMEPGDCLQRNSMLVPNASKDSFAYPELIKRKAAKVSKGRSQSPLVASAEAKPSVAFKEMIDSILNPILIKG